MDDLAGSCGVAAFLFFVNAWSNPSRNEKKTSTAYPTRKATARGEIEAPCVMVKLPNRPTTAPPIPAMRKRAKLALDDGINVSVRNSSSKVLNRYAHVPKSAYKTGSKQVVIAP